MTALLDTAQLNGAGPRDASLYRNPTVNFDVASRAHSILVRRLVNKFGNTLSDAHDRALWHMVDGLTCQTFGQSGGRLAYPLPCGAGKTQGVVAFIAALYEVGQEDGVPFCGKALLVAATQIDALITLRGDLLSLGIPDAAIGLMYSDGIKRDIPPTTDNDTRPILLVSHARVRGTAVASKFEAVTMFEGRQRDLLVWDEVLFSTDAFAVTTADAAEAAAVAHARALYEGLEGQQACAEYLAECMSRIRVESDRQAHGEPPQLVPLPALEELQVDQYLGAFKRRTGEDFSALRAFLTMNGEAVRVAFIANAGPTNEAALVRFVVSVPDTFCNIAILDAGHLVNRLVKLDSSISLAAGFTEGDVIKSYGTLRIHHRVGTSGRDSTEKDWSAANSDMRMAPREVVRVVKDIPTDEAVAIWTFKNRNRRAPDLPAIIRHRLVEAGVDVDATINGKPRICILTYGQHLGLNDWSHCQNAVFAGVLQRSPEDLLASSIAQTRDPLSSTSALIPLAEVSRGDVAGTLYQAISRGHSRFTDSGVAHPMKVWLQHSDPLIRTELDRLLPGAVWTDWQADGAAGLEGKTYEVARKIADALSKLSTSVQTVSVRKLKEGHGLKSIPDKTFKDARELLHKGALGRIGWELCGRSFVRIGSAVHHGFAAEAA